MSNITLTPSGGNDTSAVQNAINSASPGDVITFGGGDYQLDGVTLRSGVTYQGANGATLHATGSGPVFGVDSADSHDIAIKGLTFVGTGANPTQGVVELSGDGSANSVSNISITGSHFVNNGLFFVGLKQSHVDGNTFDHIGGTGSGVFGYHADNSSFNGNAFTDVYQGMSLIFGGAPNQGNNIVVADNTGSGISRMGIEIQGNDPPQAGETQNLLVQGNHFAGWTNPVSDGNTIAYSIVTDGGVGTQVLDNYAQGNVSTGMGIELAGTNAVAKGNYIDGFDGGVIAYTAGDSIIGNNLINQHGQATSDFGQPNVTIQNNTSDPSLAVPGVAATPSVAPPAAVDTTAAHSPATPTPTDATASATHTTADGATHTATDATHTTTGAATTPSDASATDVAATHAQGSTTGAPTPVQDSSSSASAESASTPSASTADAANSDASTTQSHSASSDGAATGAATVSADAAGHDGLAAYIHGLAGQHGGGAHLTSLADLHAGAAALASNGTPNIQLPANAADAATAALADAGAADGATPSPQAHDGHTHDCHGHNGHAHDAHAHWHG